MISINELREQILFEGIADSGLEKLSKITRELSLKKDEFLFKEGEDTKGIYMIRSGKIEITKTTTDGWKQTLAILSTGNFLGELSIIEKRKHEANAVAIENTELLKLPKEEFEKLEKEDVVLASQILKKLVLVMCKNLRRMNEKFLNALINY
ncbi:MAG: cyclic nucleotide-binding domain-containing protein [Thermodesulfovibrionales bacterium]|nr:cyclic nucleotide-binding domain-containing protein [Nitrospinota bacterium]MCG2710156.1 cyclic nucleotide-binding domain-containing protein [Thermodesulfovibrionales bacterium]MCG2813476.1 cyclic nucleotide-binding domain-containing protein [Thermodesulfovibrionales bacterium]MDP3048953.1 cyclic nucleotide-binding domain-containing protein [Thermodesulfovibrionales bacterium]